MNRWSIRQANSRLHAQVKSALENELLQRAQDEKTQTGIAIPHSSMVRGTKTYGFKDPFKTAPVEAWQEMKDQELPKFEQLMQLNTYSPLTQSNFSSFLERLRAQQNLQFLMDLDTHDKLWRAYLQSIDRQNRQRLSRFLDSAAAIGERKDTKLEIDMYYETPDTQDLLQPHLPSYASRNPIHQNKPLCRQDLVNNAQRIYQTYHTSIHLPKDHQETLEELVNICDRPEPVVFDSAKEHVFEVLSRFYYPLFLQQVLYQNISSTTSHLLLFLAILLLTLAYSLEFAFIFLDSSLTRWVALPAFFFGWSLFIASVTQFAWWFGILGVK
ncbi:hypothetical protein G6F56_009575 [Rhizopus delemar]|nr:hypothetical protein G6F56_009575 [Rhizopus delemar]